MTIQTSPSAAHNLLRIDPLGGVARVYHQLRPLDDRLVVVAGVVGDNDDGVVLGQRVQVVERGVGHIQVVVAAVAYGGEEGIVVSDDGSSLAQQLNDGQRGRFAQVVDVALVGHAKDQDLRVFDRLAVFVESGGQVLQDEVGHAQVDLASQLDEACAEVELTGLPREIKRVYGDAMTAQTGAGIEGLEAEWLGFGRVNHLVDVDAHSHAQLLQLVDQGNVYAAVDVFKQLCHLRRRRAADLNHATKDRAVKCRCQLCGRRSAAADDLGDVVPRHGLVAWILALR